MFAVTQKPEELSPHCMPFENFWIYDLQSFHSFWKQIVRKRENVFCAPHLWEALLQAYGIHSFSPLEKLIPFAEDFHRHHRKNISPKNLERTFKIFSHLGLRKVGHLQRLTSSEIQKRFGVAWGVFFKGILNPSTATWIWKPHQKIKNVEWNFEFDTPSNEALQLLKEIENGLRSLAEVHPLFGVQKILIQFSLFEMPEETTDVEIPFSHRPLLKRDSKWLMKMIEELLLHLRLLERVEKIHLELVPAEPPTSLQLSLFQNKAEQMRWEDLVKKLEDRQFLVFQPIPTTSYLPEISWKKESPLLVPPSLEFQSHGLYRPLIQQGPKAIRPPLGHLRFSERLTWFDEAGKRHQRDYFIGRERQTWTWIFRNQNSEWFQQGILE